MLILSVKKPTYTVHIQTNLLFHLQKSALVSALAKMHRYVKCFTYF